jgi:hypothetical protein
VSAICSGCMRRTNRFAGWGGQFLGRRPGVRLKRGVPDAGRRMWWTICGMLVEPSKKLLSCRATLAVC